MKKIYVLFLLALLPILASADAVKIGSIYYNLYAEDKTAEVAWNLNKYSGKVVIPNTVTYNNIVYKVTSIGDDAFEQCWDLTSVTIPTSVISIGESAFNRCSSLTSITIPNSVTSIGDDAFGGCRRLTSVTIPNSVTSIGSLAFMDCTGLTTVTIGNGVTSLQLSAFSHCSSLTTVTIGNSVTTISDQAFAECTALTSITIPNSVTYIGNLAFWGSGLTSITIPNSVTTIDNQAFHHCTALTSVTIPNSVTSIGVNAFDDTPWYNNKPDGVVYAGKVLYKYKGTMPNGTKISVKNGTIGIAGGAFYECNGLTSIDIPNSVTSIGREAFSGTPWYNNKPDGVVYAGKVLYKYKGNMPEGTKISIKDGTIGIADGAFSKCSGLTSIIIPNSVTTIGGYAFMDCSGLTSVTIPKSVTSIGTAAFSGCSGLTSITIPNSVTSIGRAAFSGCSGLTSITIPNSVTSIGIYAFSVKALTDVYCYAENVPTTAYPTFITSSLSNATLHVPTGSVDAYKAVEPWNKFKEIVGTTAKVKLNKTKATLEKGNTLTLKATVTPSTLPDKSVTWKSSNTKVATVTSGGKVKGIKAGTATITCTSNITGAKATCKVTVFEGSVTLDKTEVTLQKGKTVKLTPTVLPATLEDKSVTWTSSNTKVATVTTAGKVKGVKAGTATITCTSNATGMSATCKVTVINGTVTLNKTEAIIEKGKTTTLKATLTPTDLSDKSVTWTSSDKSIATVTSKGKVKGVGYGTAIITCTSNATGVSATCQVTVGKVVISMFEFTLKKSRTNVLTATVYPSTLADKSVTWKSSDTKVATVTSSGKVKGIGAGTATITCTSVATGLKGTCTVTVLATSESRSVDGNDDNVTGIENLDEVPVATEPYDVYDLSGRKVLNQTTSLDGLPAGIYIVNGKKVLKK